MKKELNGCLITLNPDMHFFADTWKKRLPQFVSFRSDSESIAVNSLNIIWG